MSCKENRFKQVDHWNETLLMNRLEYNLKTWFDWRFLRIGAWNNVAHPTRTGLGTSNLAVLRLSNDPNYTDGTVYEGVRKDWVWETGVDYVDYNSATQNPTSPAVIYVDGTPTAPDHINYPEGKVVFSTAPSSTAVVTADYSYRNVQVYIADDAPWWNELQYNSYQQNDSQFSQQSDGSWAIGTYNRIQMPCVIIEAVPRAVSTPYQLGDGSAWVQQDILVHILAENRRERNKLVDICRGQFDNAVCLFDNDSAAIAEDSPLDYQGDIADSSITYQYLIDNHYWTVTRLIRTEVSQVEAINSSLHEGIVRITAEVILPD